MKYSIMPNISVNKWDVQEKGGEQLKGCWKDYMRIIEEGWFFLKKLLIIPRTLRFAVRLTTELFAHPQWLTIDNGKAFTMI